MLALKPFDRDAFLQTVLYFLDGVLLNFENPGIIGCSNTLGVTAKQVRFTDPKPPNTGLAQQGGFWYFNLRDMIPTLAAKQFYQTKRSHYHIISQISKAN